MHHFEYRDSNPWQPNEKDISYFYAMPPAYWLSLLEVPMQDDADLNIAVF